MRSVCEESYGLEKLPRSDSAKTDGELRLRNRKFKACQGCGCKLNPKSAGFKAMLEGWGFSFETESFGHHRTCPSFAPPARTTVATIRMGSFWTLLTGAIEASIAITRGAGGLSISPNLQCAYVVLDDSPAFSLIESIWKKWLSHTTYQPRRYRSIGELNARLDSKIHELEQLFRAGRASPYGVTLARDTLLQRVRVIMFLTNSH